MLSLPAWGRNATTCRGCHEFSSPPGTSNHMPLCQPLKMDQYLFIISMHKSQCQLTRLPGLICIGRLRRRKHNERKRNEMVVGRWWIVLPLCHSTSVNVWFIFYGLPLIMNGWWGLGPKRLHHSASCDGPTPSSHDDTPTTCLLYAKWRESGACWCTIESLFIRPVITLPCLSFSYVNVKLTEQHTVY